MIIVIDSGHGYKYGKSGNILWDPGAIGELNGAKYEEARIAALYAQSLAYHLRLFEPKAQVHLLLADKPEKALTLQMRRRFLPQADAFVSIHLNAATHPNAQGFETLYSRPLSLPLAQVCHGALQRAFVGRIDRGIKQQGLTVGQRPTPAVLLELGFITNPQELEYLLRRETRARMVQELARALIKFVSG